MGFHTHGPCTFHPWWLIFSPQHFQLLDVWRVRLHSGESGARSAATSGRRPLPLPPPQDASRMVSNSAKASPVQCTQSLKCCDFLFQLCAGHLLHGESVRLVFWDEAAHGKHRQGKTSTKETFVLTLMLAFDNVNDLKRKNVGLQVRQKFELHFDDMKSRLGDVRNIRSKVDKWYPCLLLLLPFVFLWQCRVWCYPLPFLIKKALCSQ